MTEEEREYYESYRLQLQAVVDKSEDEFEKRLLYIATGALGLSFSFIADIVEIEKSSMKCLLIIGWILLAMCILVNLWSHISSKNKASKMIDNIDKHLVLEENNNSELIHNIDKMNAETSMINIITVILLLSGILSIIIFTAYNILK